MNEIKRKKFTRKTNAFHSGFWKCTVVVCGRMLTACCKQYYGILGTQIHIPKLNFRKSERERDWSSSDRLANQRTLACAHCSYARCKYADLGAFEQANSGMTCRANGNEHKKYEFKQICLRFYSFDHSKSGSFPFLMFTFFVVY